MFCSDVFIAVCLGQIKNDSGGHRTEQTSHPRAHWAKEMKMDLVFCLDRRATTMSLICGRIYSPPPLKAKGRERDGKEFS